MNNLSLQSNKLPIKEEKKIDKIIRNFKKEKHIWFICIPIIIWVFTFAYAPMYGMLIAFFHYVPGKTILQCDWAGLFYFKQFFNSPEFFNILRNTLAISGLNLLFGFPAPIILAILSNEIGNKRFKKTVQTISYLPHFISWVVTASLIFSLLSTDGVITMLFQKLGILEVGASVLGEGKYFWGILTSANIWKGVGWSSILYLSAISGIDGELYDAAAVDGVSRFGRIWHITLPGIRPTIILLLILQIGSILNAGFEQQLLLGSPQTREYWDVIDTYAYRYGIQLGRYSYGMAVGLLKSVIALVLVFLTNKLSKKLFDLSVI